MPSGRIRGKFKAQKLKVKSQNHEVKGKAGFGRSDAAGGAEQAVRDEEEDGGWER